VDSGILLLCSTVLLLLLWILVRIIGRIRESFEGLGSQGELVVVAVWFLFAAVVDSYNGRVVGCIAMAMVVVWCGVVRPSISSNPRALLVVYFGMVRFAFWHGEVLAC